MILYIKFCIIICFKQPILQFYILSNFYWFNIKIYNRHNMSNFIKNIFLNKFFNYKTEYNTI